MTECDEIAANIAASLPVGTIPTTLDAARKIVRERMTDDYSPQWIDNTAEALVWYCRITNWSDQT